MTSPQPPSFWQRVAAAEERDECRPDLLPYNSPAFTTTRDDLWNAPEGRLAGDAPIMTVHLVNPSHLSFGVGVITTDANRFGCVTACRDGNDR